jgi:hypothetical protein
VVGMPGSGTPAGTVGTALTNLEDRAHTHSGSATVDLDSGDDSSGSKSGGSPSGSDSHQTASVSLTTSAAHTSDVMPYVQLLACQKQ